MYFVQNVTEEKYDVSVSSMGDKMVVKQQSEPCVTCTISLTSPSVKDDWQATGNQSCSLLSVCFIRCMCWQPNLWDLFLSMGSPDPECSDPDRIPRFLIRPDLDLDWMAENNGYPATSGYWSGTPLFVRCSLKFQQIVTCTVDSSSKVYTMHMLN